MRESATGVLMQTLTTAAFSSTQPMGHQKLMGGCYHAPSVEVEMLGDRRISAYSAQYADREEHDQAGCPMALTRWLSSKVRGDCGLALP